MLLSNMGQVIQMNVEFDYRQAFSRNLGWVTEEEQIILRDKRIAIAGMGGVGGSHLLTLARLGIGRFHIADFDVFDIQNLNRQAGALLSTLGRPKVAVLAECAADINPQVDTRLFPTGIAVANLDEFLEGVDLYVDSLDFFAVAIRRRVFAACHERGIPAITAAPLGMGVAYLAFSPGGMSFEEYFRLEGHLEHEQLVRFLVGLSPAMLQMRYLVDPSRVDLPRHRGPSTVMACQLCAGVAATEALKILLGRGPVTVAPKGLHFDAYRNRYVRTWRPGGNSNPLQRVILAIVRRRLARAMDRARTEKRQPSLIRALRILELARWAPSGDNTQPWRFEVLTPDRFLVHGFDTRDECVYDLDGHASQISLGALLETIAIAASGERCKADFKLLQDAPEQRPTIEVALTEHGDLRVDPLLACIRRRATQRRLLSPARLAPEDRRALERCLGSGYSILWLDGWSAKWKIARLLFANGGVRLTCPEAYEVHARVIEWGTRFSSDRIPAAAVGLDPLAQRLMRWVMGSWPRVKFFNTYLGGTLWPRLKLDLLPALFCAAHFVLLSDEPMPDMAARLDAGRRLQRLWLEATRLKLQLQPEYTPLVFAEYVRAHRRFTREARLLDETERLATRLSGLLGADTLQRAVFMGRIGYGGAPSARSLRRSLDELLIERPQESEAIDDKASGRWSYPLPEYAHDSASRSSLR